jgi:hypothetical protein
LAPGWLCETNVSCIVHLLECAHPFRHERARAVARAQDFEKPHGFEDGDTVTFRELAGCTALNGGMFKIGKCTKQSFALLGVDGTALPAYAGGGIATQVKVRLRCFAGCVSECFFS